MLNTLKYQYSIYTKNEGLYRKICRKKLGNSNFTIIANNCWGGGVYEDFGLEYQTPIIGLYFFAPCYINFLKNLEVNLNKDLNFVSISKYSFANNDRAKKWYPIGILADSEIHFVHYTSEQEASEKWHRRIKRINLDNLFIAGSDRDNCSVDIIKQFDNLSFKNKVFFSSKKIEGIQSLVWLKEYQNENFIGDIYNNRWMYRKHFNVTNWLNQSLND